MGPVLMTCMARQKTIFSSVVDIGFYPATILAKNKVSVARIPIMRAKKFTFTVNTLCQPDNMNLPLGFHAA
jgi:hypothetical protein